MGNENAWNAKKMGNENAKTQKYLHSENAKTMRMHGTRMPKTKISRQRECQTSKYVDSENARQQQKSRRGECQPTTFNPALAHFHSQSNFLRATQSTFQASQLATMNASSARQPETQ
jgi:hypothetical protein